MSSDRLSWAEYGQDGSLIVYINTELYSLEALFRVCYSFTDKCYLFLEQAEDPAIIKVRFAKKDSTCDLSAIAGEFSNELIDQKLRLDIAAETKVIRELIVAQAFTEADLLDRSASDADFNDDPRGISR
jgi:His-Xaa-Ser system protein HxsD